MDFETVIKTRMSVRNFNSTELQKAFDLPKKYV